MERYRIILIAGLVAVLGTALTGQGLDQLIAQARVEISAGNYDAAKANLETVLDQDGNYAPAYFELSRVALLQDDLKGAQENIGLAIENDQRNEEYRAEADKIAELSSMMSTARRSYDERDFMAAVARYEQILEDHPTFASAYHAMGYAYKEAGMVREAAAAFRKAKQYNHDNPAYANALLKIVYDKFNEGNRLLRSRDWESALEAYKEAAELDPSFYQAYYWMARSYGILGDNETALETLDRCLAIKPDYVKGYVEKGNILLKEGSPKEAEATFRQALSLDSKSDKAWIGLGSVQRAEKPEEAIKAFKSALSSNPKSGDAAEYLGEMYSEQENWAEARKYLEQAIRLKPQSYITAWRLAVVYNSQGEHEKAQQQAKRCVTLKKTFEYGWYEKGIAEKALGNRQAAIEAFRNASRGRDAGIRKSAQYELKQLESTSW
ncbi:MAG: tetratricopeptide repeat protein [Candidatus Neomarinimicrobiota bacterium]